MCHIALVLLQLNGELVQQMFGRKCRWERSLRYQLQHLAVWAASGRYSARVVSRWLSKYKYKYQQRILVLKNSNICSICFAKDTKDKKLITIKRCHKLCEECNSTNFIKDECPICLETFTKKNMITNNCNNNCNLRPQLPISARPFLGYINSGML